jgi:hypothetical protein
MQRLIITLITLLLFFLSPRAYAISEYDLMEPVMLNVSLGTGFEFFSGDYGTGETIDTWQIPLLVEWTPHPRLGLSMEIPFIHQSSSNSQTVMIGRRATDTTSSESGLGDITLDANVTLFSESEHSPRLLALLYAKLPTADDQKGLGTGKFDWGGGIGIGQRFGAWSAYAEGLYVLAGSSDLYPLDDYWNWLASLSYRVSTTLHPGLSLSGGTAPFAGSDGPLEIKARLSGLGGERTSYSFYLSRGLSDGSPDWGVGLFGYLDF